MGKGSGPSQPSSQTVTQTNLPEYARPYFENLLQRTQAESIEITHHTKVSASLALLRGNSKYKAKSLVCRLRVSSNPLLR
jgi:hypothetical protein